MPCPGRTKARGHVRSPTSWSSPGLRSPEASLNKPSSSIAPGSSDHLIGSTIPPPPQPPASQATSSKPHNSISTATRSPNSSTPPAPSSSPPNPPPTSSSPKVNN